MNRLHVNHNIHKPNWFWVENFHGEKMKELTYANFNACTTFFIQWDEDIKIVKSENDLTNPSEHKITVSHESTYDDIVKRFAPQGSDCLAIFIMNFNKAFLAGLKENDVKGNVYIKQCLYHTIDDGTEYEVTYLLG